MTDATTLPSNRIISRIAAGRVGTEVLGRTGGWWLLSQIPSTQLEKFIANTLVSPRLEQCEAAIDKFFPTIETAEKRAERAHMPREQRVERISKELARQGIEGTGAFFVQMLGQQAFDRMFSVPALTGRQPWMVVGADRVAQIGSIFVLNGPLLNTTLSAQKFVAGFLHKQFGTPMDLAEQKATRLVNDIAPNIMGMLSSIATHSVITAGKR